MSMSDRGDHFTRGLRIRKPLAVFIRVMVLVIKFSAQGGYSDSQPFSGGIRSRSKLVSANRKYYAKNLCFPDDAAGFCMRCDCRHNLS